MQSLASELSGFLGRLLGIRKALDPNDPADFAKIVVDLQNAIKGVTGPAEAAALKSALAKLDVDWTTMKADAKAKVLTAAKGALNPSKLVLPKLESKLESTVSDIGTNAKKGAARQHNLKISGDLTKADHDVLQGIAYSQGNFVRDEYGKRSDAFALKAKQIVAEGIEKGWKNKEIADKLKEDLTAQQFNRSTAYWNVVASAFVARARTYANLSGFQEAAIQRYRLVSVLDERTSEVCRFMHGKVFDVGVALERFHAVEQLDEPEDIKFEQPWPRVSGGEIWIPGKDGSKTPLATVTKPGMGGVDTIGEYDNAASDSKLAQRGVLMPPFHGHCRTTVVPETESISMPVLAPVPQAPAFTLKPTEPDQQVNPAHPLSEVTPYESPPKEQEGFTFGPGGIDVKPIVLHPEPTPEEPSPPPVVGYKPSWAEKKAKALADLDAWAKGDNEGSPSKKPEGYLPSSVKQMLLSGVLADSSHPGWTSASKDIHKADVSIDVDLGGGWDPDTVEHLIKNNKALKATPIKAVYTKVKGPDGKNVEKLCIVEGHNAFIAQSLLGKEKVPFELLDLKVAQKAIDEKAKAAAAAPAAPPPPVVVPPPPKPPPPVAVAAPTPPPPPVATPAPAKPDAKVNGLSAADLMHEKVGEAQGSNEGGFYKGSDGKKRYVKLYADEAQAHGEVLANALYGHLGFGTPNAATVKDPATGKNVYAVDFIEGRPFGKPGFLNKDKAQKFMKGFAADILMGNWDAAGVDMNNAFQTIDGNIIRIDNGGAFLMRAKAGRKPDSVLNTITEWDYFFNESKNPGYAKIAKAAGYNSAKDFADDITKQVDNIIALRAKFGGWTAYVDTYAPNLNAADKKKIADMLESRTNLLEVKVAQLNKPKPKPQTDIPPVQAKLRWQGPSLSAGVRPHPTLDIDDLPHAEPPPGFGSQTSKAYPDRFNNDTTLPWGEDRRQYQARCNRDVRDKLDADSLSAIKAFSGNSYGAIRRSEASGNPNAQAKAIAKAFAVAPTEAVTVYRGNHSMSKEVIESFIRNDGIFQFNHGNTGGTTSSAWHPQTSVNGFMGGESEPYGDYKVLFIIHQTSGIAIEAFSVSHETEILMSAEAQYKVRQVAKWEGRERIIQIELEEI